VCAVIREKILRNQFKPGQRLDIKEMAEQMGVSRTPLKTALNRLAIEGLVDIRANSGTYVAILDARDIRESFEVRRVLEVYAVELATERVMPTELDQIRAMVARLKELALDPDWNSVCIEYCTLDHDLHRLIVACAGNSKLAELWELVNVHVQVARVRHRREDRDLAFSLREHDGLLEAFANRDPLVAKRWMDRHIKRSMVALLNDLKTLDEG
jgi:DNA-binding GntR family transcriptional regulator